LSGKKKKNGITFYVSDKEIEQLGKNNPTSMDRELAKRSDRFSAKLIDYSPALIGGALMTISNDEFIRSYLKTLFGILSNLVTLYNFFLLGTRGQTVGKYLRSIRIVNAKTGENLEWAIILFLRPLLFLICCGFIYLLGRCGQPQYALIPISLVLIDSLFIFRKDRRCLHDLIAGSEVISCNKSNIRKS